MLQELRSRLQELQMQKEAGGMFGWYQNPMLRRLLWGGLGLGAVAGLGSLAKGWGQQFQQNAMGVVNQRQQQMNQAMGGGGYNPAGNLMETMGRLPLVGPYMGGM